jgi:hypothetical protein
MIVVPLHRQVGPNTLRTLREIIERHGGAVDMHPDGGRVILRLRGPLAALEALWAEVKRAEDPPLLELGDD